MFLFRGLLLVLYLLLITFELFSVLIILLMTYLHLTVTKGKITYDFEC